MDINEYAELEMLRYKEIKDITLQAIKLIKNISNFRPNFKTDKFLLMKYEACVEDLHNINHILYELKKVRSLLNKK